MLQLNSYSVAKYSNQNIAKSGNDEFMVNQKKKTHTKITIFHMLLYKETYNQFHID